MKVRLRQLKVKVKAGQDFLELLHLRFEEIGGRVSAIEVQKYVSHLSGFQHPSVDAIS
jgi:hypothetical protein